mmetsp:Transcript_11380/g.36381  ORF Transcript_11380/g.36381 Transcript_11380/m.36381 type:complete len:362 (+) Transcript_11380:330-1415(+)
MSTSSWTERLHAASIGSSCDWNRSRERSRTQSAAQRGGSTSAMASGEEAIPSESTPRACISSASAACSDWAVSTASTKHFGALACRFALKLASEAVARNAPAAASTATRRARRGVRTGATTGGGEASGASFRLLLASRRGRWARGGVLSSLSPPPDKLLRLPPCWVPRTAARLSLRVPGGAARSAPPPAGSPPPSAFPTRSARLGGIRQTHATAASEGSLRPTAAAASSPRARTSAVASSSSSCSGASRASRARPTPSASAAETAAASHRAAVERSCVFVLLLMAARASSAASASARHEPVERAARQPRTASATTAFLSAPLLTSAGAACCASERKPGPSTRASEPVALMAEAATLTLASW